MTTPKPKGYQKRILEMFSSTYKKATGEPYGISWGIDGKGAVSVWERAYGAVVGIERYGEEPTEQEIEAAHKLIERKLAIAVELYQKDARWNPFPWSLVEFARKMMGYLDSKSSKPTSNKPTQSAEELRKELEK